MKLSKLKPFMPKLRNNVEDIIGKSSPATCGIMEKSVTVQSKNVEATKKRLRASGFRIIGTSEPGAKSRTIWFIIQGGF